MSFDEKTPKKKGLKINNQNSSAPPPKIDNSVLFDKQADLAHSKYEEYKKRTWELSVKFKSMIEDRTLLSNKSILSKGIELETLSKLVSLASEMNEDDNQPESVGSTAMTFLIMKMLLLQRDTINDLASKLDKLDKK